MKIWKATLGLLAAALFVVNLNAQDAQDASPSDVVTAVATGEVAAPTSAPSPWLGLIPILTPIIIAGAKWLVPKIPKKVLPILTPLIGAGLEIIMHYAGVQTTGGVGGAILGAAGSAVRETFDQLKKVTPPNPARA